MNNHFSAAGFHHTPNSIRPTLEASGLRLQALRGFSHLEFTFCHAYKGKK